MPWRLILGQQFSPRCHPRHNDTNCFWIGKGFLPLLGRKTGPAIPANRHDFGKRLRSYVLNGLYSLRHRPACPRQIIFDPLDICRFCFRSYNALFFNILHTDKEPGAPAKTPFHCYLLALF